MERQTLTEEQIITEAGEAIASAYDGQVENLPPATQKQLAQQLAIFFAKLAQ